MFAQLPGRLEALARVRQEKEELEQLKQDPTAVNPDDESVRRLQQIKQRHQRPAAAAAAAGGDAGAQQQQEAGGEAEAAEEEARQRRAGLGAGGGGGSGAEEGDEDAGGGEGGAAAGGADPFAGLSARQRKLMELRQKLQQCRKANEHAVIAERKRMQVRGRACRVHVAVRG